MAEGGYRLPSDVQTDADDTRVPMVGLPVNSRPYPRRQLSSESVDDVDGSFTQMDLAVEYSGLDSGIDSALSGDLRSSGFGTRLESQFENMQLAEAEQPSEITEISNDQENVSSRTRSPQNLPHDSVPNTNIYAIFQEHFEELNEDPGYASTELALPQILQECEQEKQERTTVPSTDQFEQKLLSYFRPDEDGDTQLHLAIIQHTEIVSLSLICAAPSITLLNIKNDVQQTPLHLAVLTNQPKSVRYLVAHGVPLDTRDKRGNTPLHVACHEGNIECLRQLTHPLSHDECQEIPSTCYPPGRRLPFDLSILNYEGDSCVHLAAMNNSMPIISHLLTVGADINIQDGRGGQTVLHQSINQGKTDLVFFLLTHCKADINAATYNGCMPIEMAWSRGHKPIQTVLLKFGAEMGPIYYAEMEEESEDDSSDGEEMMMQSGLAVS